MSKDFAKMKDSDLRKELDSRRNELQKVSFIFNHGGNKDTMKRSNLKREISQILNETRKRELRNN